VRRPKPARRYGESSGFVSCLEQTKTAAWKLLAQELLDDKWVGPPLTRQIGATVTVVTGNAIHFIASVNINRRHLTAETKRELIAKLLKEHRERSDRATAELVKADHKTVASVRRNQEQLGSIPQLKTMTGRMARSDPQRRLPHYVTRPHARGPTTSGPRKNRSGTRSQTRLTSTASHRAYTTSSPTASSRAPSQSRWRQSPAR
jgi:hypothetical protein